MKDISNAIDPATLDRQMIPEQMLAESMGRRAEFNAKLRASSDYMDEQVWDQFTEFKASDAQVWVDPLDGTAQFVIDNLSAVTILIGLSIKGMSKIGVVHFPYSTNDPNSESMTIFGTVEHGSFQMIADKFEPIKPFDDAFDIPKEDDTDE